MRPAQCPPGPGADVDGEGVVTGGTVVVGGVVGGSGGGGGTKPPSTAHISRRSGYGLIGPTSPGWIWKWVCVGPPAALPVLPTYPSTSPFVTTRASSAFQTPSYASRCAVVERVPVRRVEPERVPAERVVALLRDPVSDCDVRRAARREDVGALVDAPVRAGLAPVVGEGDGTRDRTEEIHHGDPGGEARIRGRRLFLGRRRGRCCGGRGGRRGGRRRGLLGGDGLVVPVEGLLLFGDLEIARDDGERVAQLLGVLVRLGDERVLPLTRGRHRVAVGLELLPVLVELVHLGVGALLRRVGEARDASAGDEVAGRADLAEDGEAGSAPTSIQHCGPVREQFLQLRDPGLETRDPLLEDGDALVESLELRVRVDVRLRRGVGVDPGLRDLGPLGLDLRVRGDRRGRRRRRPGRTRSCSWAPESRRRPRPPRDGARRGRPPARSVLGSPCASVPSRGPLDSAGRIDDGPPLRRGRPSRLAISS